MFALFAGDRLGRQWMVISGAAILIVRVIIHVTSFVGHIPVLQSMFGRGITGIGNGMNMSTIPTYQAECSRTSKRGLLICIEDGIIAIGTAIAYWVDLVPRTVLPIWSGSSRFLFRLFSVLLFLLACTFCLIRLAILFLRVRFMRESMCSLLWRGRRSTIMRLSCRSSLSLNLLKRMVYLVVYFGFFSANPSSSAGVAEGAGYSDLLTGSRTQHLHRRLISSSSQIVQQLSGCNAVI